MGNRSVSIAVALIALNSLGCESAWADADRPLAERRTSIVDMVGDKATDQLDDYLHTQLAAN